MQFSIRIPASYVEQVNTIIHSWRQEHDGYYGLPCGSRLVDLDQESILRSNRLSIDNWPQQRLGYSQISDEDIDVAQWLAVSGNEWQIQWQSETDEHILCYRGRRHGQVRFPAELLQAGSIVFYETEAPWLQPWELNTKDGMARWACEQDNQNGASDLPTSAKG